MREHCVAKQDRRPLRVYSRFVNSRQAHALARHQPIAVQTGVHEHELVNRSITGLRQLPARIPFVHQHGLAGTGAQRRVWLLGVRARSVVDEADDEKEHDCDEEEEREEHAVCMRTAAACEVPALVLSQRRQVTHKICQSKAQCAKRKGGEPAVS